MSRSIWGRHAAKEPRLAQAHQGAADLRLEDHHRGEGREQQGLAVEKLDSLELQLRPDDPDDQVEHQEEDTNPLEHPRAARAAQEPDHAEDERADEQQLDADLEPSVDPNGPEEYFQVQQIDIHNTIPRVAVIAITTRLFNA